MGEPVYEAILPAPFGALGVRLAGGLLTGLDFLPPGTHLKASPQPLVAETARELEAYYRDPQHRFTLPLGLTGTPFRRRVWDAMTQITAGETATYGDIAHRLGSSPRAVGQAVGDNPIPIIIPCHRVLAKNGLGGFMHSGDAFPLDVKCWLLAHEGITL